MACYYSPFPMPGLYSLWCHSLFCALPAEEEVCLALLFGMLLIIVPQEQVGEERPQTPSPIVSFPHLKVI